MRATVVAWAVILAIQIVVMTLFFKPFVKEATLAVYVVTMALQGYQVLVFRPSWTKFLR